MLGDCGRAEGVRNACCSLAACGLKQIDTAFLEDDCAAASLVPAMGVELPPPPPPLLLLLQV
jgi:hypothetical protein